jgi:hypothetical protein
VDTSAAARCVRVHFISYSPWLNSSSRLFFFAAAA